MKIKEVIEYLQSLEDKEKDFDLSVEIGIKCKDWGISLISQELKFNTKNKRLICPVINIDPECNSGNEIMIGDWHLLNFHDFLKMEKLMKQEKQKQAK